MVNEKDDDSENIQRPERSGIFAELNVFGRYQKRLFLLIFLSTIPNGLNTFQFLVVHHTPEFRCDDPIPQQMRAATSNFTEQVYNLTHSAEHTKADVCSYLNMTANFGNTSQQNNRSVEVPCSNIVFEGKDVTVVTELGMVCGNAWQKPMSTSAFMMGKLVGGCLGGIVSDRFGRKTTFLLFSAWQYSTSFASSFASDPTAYTVLMFLNGCGGLVNFVAAVLLGTEMVPKNWRSFVIAMTEVGFGVGCLIIGFVAYLIHDWRWYLRFTGLIGLLYIPYIWLLDESPRWLMASGKSKQAIKLLRKVAKVNGLKVDEDVVTETIALTTITKKETNGSTWKTFISIICSRRLLLRLVIVCYSWAIVSLTYYMISLDSASWSDNRYLNMTLLGVAEIVATTIFYFGVQHIGRKNTYIAFISLTSLCVAAVPYIKMWNPSLVVVAVISGRLFVTAAYCVVYVHTVELFPTVVRNMVMGLASACSRIGSMLAPFIIYIGHQTKGPTMSVIMAAIILLSAATFLVLPETRNAQLPQTIEDAKRMKSSVKIITQCQGKEKRSATRDGKTSV